MICSLKIKCPGGEIGRHAIFWDRMVKKYGLEEAKRMNAKGREGNKNASGNKGKPKSEEHKAKIAANRKGGRQKKNIGDMA